MPSAVKVLHLSAADNMLFPILRDQLLHLRAAGFDVHTASMDGPLGRRIRDDCGFPWTPLPLDRRVAPLKDLRALRFIQRFCREQRFQIVHTHTPKGNLVGQWAARRAGVPVVLQTLHGFYFHERMPAPKRRLWIGIERFSARHSDHILCQNPEDVETAVQERICAADRITLLGNGIDLDAIRPVAADSPARVATRRALGIAADAVVIGMVGRFVAEKGFPEFLAAAQQLAAGQANLHFLAVGHRLASERTGAAVTLLARGALEGRLTVLTDRDDMPALYNAMDIHVLPSHREGFPRVLMEGAAAGLPQVATRIRGCRQTIDDGTTGYLVDVGDVTALAGRIGALAANVGLRTEMGGAARRKAEAEFDQRRVFECVEACYGRLLKEKGIA